MDINRFLELVKTNQLGLMKSTPVSAKGRIDDIRKRTAEKLAGGGIAQYSQLGSGNAIGYMPTPEVKFEPEAPEAPKKTMAEEIAEALAEHDKKKEEEEEEEEEEEQEATPKGYGMGGKGQQSALSKVVTDEKVRQEKEKEERIDQMRKEYNDKMASQVAERTPEPKNSPPFNLDTSEGQQGLKKWQEYAKIKFWNIPKGQPTPDVLVGNDSQDFTFFLRMRVKNAKNVEEFYKENPFADLANYVGNAAIGLGKELLGMATKLAKSQAAQAIEAYKISGYDVETESQQKAYKQLKSLIPTDAMIDKFSNYINKVLPSTSKTYRERINDFENQVLELHPAWKNHIKKDAWKELDDMMDIFNKALYS